MKDILRRQLAVGFEGMKTAVRPVELRDLPNLIPLCRSHAEYEGADYKENGQVDRLQRALFGDYPVLFAWVVDTGERLVGYLSATRDFATWPADFFIHMDCLYLDEEFRGKGLGYELMQALVRFARVQGCDLIQWQTPPANERGMAFYKRIGACSLDKKRYFYSSEAW